MMPGCGGTPHAPLMDYCADDSGGIQSVSWCKATMMPDTDGDYAHGFIHQQTAGDLCDVSGNMKSAKRARVTRGGFSNDSGNDSGAHRRRRLDGPHEGPGSRSKYTRGPPPGWDSCDLHWFRYGTWNCRKSLADHAHDILAWAVERHLLVVMLTDVSRVSSNTRAYFEEEGWTFHYTPPGRWLRAVALLVHPDCEPIDNPSKCASGGIITQTVLWKNNRIRCCAIYQPPGLGNAQAPDRNNDYDARPVHPDGATLKGAGLRAEGEWQANVLLQSMQAPGVHLSVGAGDFNETPNPVVDRAIGQPEGPRRGLQRGNHTVKRVTMYCTDVYRAAHPVSETEVVQGNASVQSQGHTYYGKGSSRIDLSFCYPKHPGGVMAFVDDQHDLSTDGKDHRPVCFAVLVPERVADCPKRPKPFPPPVKAKTVFANDMTPAQAEELCTRANAAICPHVHGWVDELRSLKHKDSTAQKVLSRVVSAFGDTVFEVALHVLGGVRCQSRRRIRPTPELMKATQALKYAKRLRALLVGCTDNSLYSTRAVNAVRTIVHLDLTEPTNLPRRPPKFSDKIFWSRWLSQWNLLKKSLRATHKAALRRHPHHPTNRTQNQFRSSTGRGKYYASIRDNTQATVVSEAVDVQGVTHTDPKKYMPVLKKHYQALLSNFKPGPCVPLWRWNTPEELTTGVPFWWQKIHEALADPRIWHGLMDRPVLWEIYRWLRKGGNPAPGLDGLPKQALRAICGLVESRPLPATPTLATQFMLAYVGARYETCVSPDSAKVGVIVPVPKPGVTTRSQVNKRPLTLLNELAYKLPDGVLAARITRVFHDHPDVLELTNRAYLHDGNHKQCLADLVNAIEDHNERRATRIIARLFNLSYDVEKAFDTLQYFTIETGCTSLAMPERAVEYVGEMLRGATRAVRTAHGLTSFFGLLTSVFQGGSMSGNLFVIAVNPLLRGFRDNPLANRFPLSYRTPHGYRMSGYSMRGTQFADDRDTMDDDWEGTVSQHHWVLEWTTANHIKCNVKKTIFQLSTTWNEGTNYFLPAADMLLVHDPAAGKPAPHHLLTLAPVPFTDPDDGVRPSPPSDAHRNLGFMLNLTLDPKGTTEMIHGRVFQVADHIRKDHLMPLDVSRLISEFMLPRIESGLTISSNRIAPKSYSLWRKVLRRAALRSELGPHVTSVCNAALHFFLRLPDLCAYAGLLNAIDVAQNLRAHPVGCARTTQIRLQTAVGAGHLRISTVRVSGFQLQFVEPRKRMPPEAIRGSRTVAAAWYLLQNHITFSWKTADEKDILDEFIDPATLPMSCIGVPIALPQPLEGPIRMVGIMVSPPADGVVVFTDGSYQALDKRGGCAMVYCRKRDYEDPTFTPEIGVNVVVHAAPTPPSGANYTAEAVAHVHAKLCLPVNVRRFFFSDALSLLQATENPVLALGKQTRTGSRSAIKLTRLLDAVNKLLAPAPIYEHVRAHTGGSELKYQLNELADEYCTKGVAMDTAPPLLTCEDEYVFWTFQGEALTVGSALADGVEHVSGSLTKLLKSKLAERAMHRWQSHQSQGRVARANPSSLVTLIRLAERKGQVGLHMFLLLFSVGQSPTADRFAFGRERTSFALACVLCGRPQSANHIYECPRMIVEVSAHREVALSVIRRLVSLVGTYSPTHPRWPLVQSSPHWLSWFVPGPSPPIPLHLCADDDDRAYIGSLQRFDTLAGVIGVLPPGLISFLCPNPFEAGVLNPRLRAIKKEIRDLTAQLQTSLLESAWNVFQQYQLKVIAPVVLSPMELLCGLTISGLITNRVARANGAAPTYAALEANALRDGAL